MKKYIYTEAQIKGVIDHVMNERIMNEQAGQILKIRDLAEIASRSGNDFKTLLTLFQRVFKDSGDIGVIEFFKSATDLAIEDMGHGRYQLKY